jgi:uncharacterized membrane-anchored protein
MNRFVLLVLAAAFQLVVLAWEYLGSRWPEWTGERVTLAVRPVDPRSWFSGNYAELTYDVATLEPALYSGSDATLREGEVVYVALEKEGDVWQATRLTLDPPQSGTFLRGRLEQRWSSGSAFRVRYGIEAWFAPKEKALAIERAVRQAGPAWPGWFGGDGTSLEPQSPVRAHVAITASGKAGLLDLELP